MAGKTGAGILTLSLPRLLIQTGNRSEAVLTNSLAH
jgi:hypothetical protein